MPHRNCKGVTKIIDGSLKRNYDFVAMFTGIIAALGRVDAATGNLLVIASKKIAAQTQIGESVAVSGVCLTAVAVHKRRGLLEFNLSQETKERTTLGDLHRGSSVNLEWALAFGDRLGGHLLYGHVDALGEVIKITQQSDSHLFKFRVDPKFEPRLVEKGAVALDGISLTPFHIAQGSFEVAVIPHTFKHTTLQDRKTGDKVNVEFDILAKYAEKLLRREES